MTSLSRTVQTKTTRVDVKVDVATKPTGVKGKAPYLSVTTRMGLAEQRLMKLEQEDEWWINWKANKFQKQETSPVSSQDDITAAASAEGDEDVMDPVTSSA